MIESINEAVAYVRSKSSLQPEVGVILGSGLGNVVDGVDIEASIPYGDIPGARASTVLGHQGRLILGRAKGTPVVMMQGRVHFYEGYEMHEVMYLSRDIGRLVTGVPFSPITSSTTKVMLPTGRAVQRVRIDAIGPGPVRV